MDQAENKRLIEDYINRVINTGDDSDMERYLAPDYTEVHSFNREKIGIDEAKKRLHGIRNTYPDFHVEIDRQIAEGDWVATSCTFSGTHLGQWMGLKPTGKKLRYTGVIVDQVKNGRIREHGGAVNLFDVFFREGLIKFTE